MRSVLLYALLLPLCTNAQTPQLWGMTTGGGANSHGTIFHIDADGTDFVKVFDFDETSGRDPEGGLCLAPNGKLYGTTWAGGEGNLVAGTLFSFDPNGAGFHKIVDFDISNGGGNWGSLVLYEDGLLYGAQYMGGGGGGSIYTVDPATDTYTIVHNLYAPTEGSSVTDNLLVASDGWLYACSASGGAFNAGTIFRFDPLTQAFETLHDFTGDEGGTAPYGGLCQADNGWLYGTTFTGGLNLTGILYKYDPVGDQFVKLADLDTIPGSNCWSRMVNAGPDLLVGTVATGGQYSSGFLYGITPSTDAFAQVFPFNPVTGGNELGNAILGSDGMLYGQTGLGGTSGAGTIYRFDPTTHVHTNIHSFDVSNGAGPRGELTEAGTAVGISEQDEPTIGVSPNPTSGSVTVMWAERSANDAHFCITDAVGRALRTGTLLGNSTVLDMPAAPGNYALTITSAHARRTVRIVKR